MHQVQEDLHETKQTLKKTNFLLRGMRSIGGRIRNAMGKPPEAEPMPAKQVRSTGRKKVSADTQQQSQTTSGTSTSERAPPKNRFEAAQHRQDEKLDVVSDMLTGLNAMAVDIGQELDDQNDLLNGIDNQMEDVQADMDSQNRQIRHILS
jgi:hypothetical protein